MITWLCLVGKEFDKPLKYIIGVREVNFSLIENYIFR